MNLQPEKRKKKISKTFLSDYPVAKSQITTLDNFDEFIS
jgi:hypothetical protein